AVESTGRYSDARILALNSYENRVYRVGLEGEAAVIVKFYRPERWTAEQIDEEHRFTQHLFDSDIPVVPPLEIESSTGFSTLGQYDEFLFSLYPVQGGRAPELDNFDHLHQLGIFIGRIHAAGQSFEFNFRQKLSSERLAVSSVDYLLEAQFIPADLVLSYKAVTGEILDAISQRRPESDNFQQIRLHGDCHNGNVLWRDDRPHFVDFDDATTGPAIQDLWMMLSGEIPHQQRQLLEILEGYEMFMPFDVRELDLIESLRAMRVLHFNAWLARRWDDPAFPQSFPWFNTERYWSEHILELKEVLTGLQQPAIRLPDI
ncbi:MAG: serine/threonine protein kinase, partial [Pseudomonadota bacterium]